MGRFLFILSCTLGLCFGGVINMGLQPYLNMKGGYNCKKHGYHRSWTSMMGNAGYEPSSNYGVGGFNVPARFGGAPMPMGVKAFDSDNQVNDMKRDSQAAFGNPMSLTKGLKIPDPFAKVTGFGVSDLHAPVKGFGSSLFPLPGGLDSSMYSGFGGSQQFQDLGLFGPYGQYDGMDNSLPINAVTNQVASQTTFSGMNNNGQNNKNGYDYNNGMNSNMWGNNNRMSNNGWDNNYQMVNNGWDNNNAINTNGWDNNNGLGNMRMNSDGYDNNKLMNNNGLNSNNGWNGQGWYYNSGINSNGWDNIVNNNGWENNNEINNIGWDNNNNKISNNLFENNSGSTSSENHDITFINSLGSGETKIDTTTESSLKLEIHTNK
ncbi:homeobox protein 5-like [Dreissena polymorpha]|uniref:Uncharacterized protein n=1 Tax=Dreissena polymorpha TaxID=45954 RepID=A0A9D4R5P8_DREPO|nr:homeobox protein 5-like [Dreissena polymorpha]KAH3854190.1 hypothetical protein DPMN_096729 [Dreissena polymorpha]